LINKHAVQSYIIKTENSISHLFNLIMCAGLLLYSGFLLSLVWQENKMIYNKCTALIHPFIHPPIHRFIRTYIYMHAYTCTHIYKHAYIYIYIHTCLHTYIHTHIYTYVRNKICACHFTFHVLYNVKLFLIFQRRC
jgi:hypothetical protein